jgi:hypothetical protein
MRNTSLINNPEYDDHKANWELVEDCVAGSWKIKKEKTKYLPIPNPDESTSDVNNPRYAQYLLRAVFFNVCYKTLMGLVGIVYRKAPRVEVPNTIDYLIDNADGSGISLNQQSQWVLSEVIKKGRCAMLVDYPTVDGQTSRADVARGIRATIKTYAAECVTDWNEEQTETGTRLNYVKLKENESVLNIMTGEREQVITYIVLRLVEGVYSIERYNEDGTSTGDYVEPRLANGQTLNYIPLVFTGSENNNPDVDQALLYDLAVLNCAHYNNSADAEESSFIAGQPTLAVTSSLNATEWAEGNPNGVVLGSRKGHFLGESGGMSLVQADANLLPREMMKDKEAQFVALGAQIVSDNTAQETAFAVGAKLSTNTSSLALSAGNVSDAYKICLKWCDAYMSTAPSDEIVFTLNSDFFPASMDAPTITAWVAGIQGGVLPKSAFYDQMRDANLTSLDDESIKAEIEESGDGINLGAE